MYLVRRIDKGNTQTPLNKSVSKIKDELIVGISWLEWQLLCGCAYKCICTCERDNKDNIEKGMALCIAMDFFFSFGESYQGRQKKLYLVPDKTISAPQITTHFIGKRRRIEKQNTVMEKKKRKHT